MRYLEEEEGFQVTYLPVDRNGKISLGALRDALCKETILVSVMYVNNEMGALEPIKEASAIVKSYNRDIIFHSDAVQGFGKYRIYPKREGIDLLTVSSHKIHGPKGVGALYINEKVRVHPIIFGGEQQKNIRSGTENVPGIAGFALASRMIYTNLEEKTERMRRLKARFVDGIRKIDHVKIHGYVDDNSAPHIVSAGIGASAAKYFACPGRERHLCFFRIGVCIQPSGHQQGAQRNWRGERVPGCNSSFQHVRIYNGRRN